jgi:phosphatidylcholine synthase
VISGLLPLGVAIVCAVAIIISGALYFADRQMKTPDYYFRGFPAVWNVPLFYLFLLQPPAWIAALGISLLALATFLPIPFVHPFRVKRGRAISIALLVIWSGLACVTLLRDMMPEPWITAALCAIALYFLGAGVLRRTDA